MPALTAAGRMMRSLLAILAILIGCHAAQAAEPEWRHGVSLTGSLKYKPGFTHFDYVRPDAPKGGTVRLSVAGAFDSLNFVIPRGTPAPGVEGYVVQQLMAQSLDEPLSSYGQVAEAVRYPDDFAWVSFRLNPKARWHDGQPVTPEDVIFSFNAQVANDPSKRLYYHNIVKVEKTSEREVTFTLDHPGNREIASILCQLDVLPKHWWEGTDAKGNKRDITQTTLEPLLGSGPYRIKSVDPGRGISFERVRDWWGANEPINVGRYNFDELRIIVFRDSTVELEAFKADEIDWRSENSVLQWSTQYDFPAVRDGRVVKESFPQRGVGRMQGFAFNIRRGKFADPRVRQAFDYAFDFEEANRSLFFGLYKRISSYFDGTELASSGVPQGLELQILESVRGMVPDDLFTKPYVNPVGGTPEKARDNLRQANRLLTEAGWVIKGRQLVNGKTGEQLTAEFLISSPAFERIILPYKANLEKLGIAVTLRLVDPSQYIARLNNRDFDIIVGLWLESLSPGNEQRDFWGSEAADRDNSRNYIGIKNKAVDMLADRIIFAKDRDELVAATHALDRVLLWNHYVVPQYTLDESWTARWDRFNRPSVLPTYGASGFPDIWWYDGEKAKKVGGRP